jgi:hypothetical protein
MWKAWQLEERYYPLIANVRKSTEAENTMSPPAFRIGVGMHNAFCHSNVSHSLYSNHCSLFTLTFFIIRLGELVHRLVFES